VSNRYSKFSQIDVRQAVSLGTLCSFPWTDELYCLASRWSPIEWELCSTAQMRDRT
jgi:hypothetical protein